MNDRLDQPPARHETEPVEQGPDRTTDGFSRRRVLLGGGVGALALLGAACGGEDEGPASSGDPTSTTVAGAAASESETESGSAPPEPDRDVTGDLAVAVLAARLEVLAVNTYGAALDAAEAGDLGDVPPAVAEFITTAQEHHQAALDAWNEVLLGAGETQVSSPPADLEAMVEDRLGAVDDVEGVAEIALMLEQVAAATYLDAIPRLEDPAAIGLAASIQPIDMQHVAVLLFVLGEYPVPDTFASTEEAYTG